MRGIFRARAKLTTREKKADAKVAHLDGLQLELWEITTLVRLELVEFHFILPVIVRDLFC